MRSFCLRVFERPLLVVSLATIAVSGALEAQQFYGTTVGTVLDSSGAVVPGATVTIVNLGTNETRTTQSSKTGEYSFVQLVPAQYRIEVSQTAFKRVVREPVEIQVGNTTRIDFQLQVGAVSEVVTVSTQTPLLQTESGANSSIIEGQAVQEIPLNGRNPMNLIELSAGVVPQGSTSGNAALNQNGGGNTQPGGWGNYAISGGLAGYSAMYLDGAPNNVLGENDVALVPVQDAIQEFSVLSSSVPAEYGRFEGGIVNMTTKSGTNKFHGSAYEYVRNRDFNANSWFNKASQIFAGKSNVPPAYTQNQFGVVVDGPIKRDKAFFLFTWERFRLRQGQVTSYSVPTAQNQQGVFTGLATPLVDPLGNCNIATSGSAGNYTSTITNLSTCASPTGKVMAKYYDLPNLPGTGVNYVTAIPGGANTEQYNGRVDYNVTQKQHIFGRYTYWKLFELPFNPFPDNTAYNTSNPTHQYITHQAVLGDTYSLNSKTILDFRISALHQQLNGAMPTTSDYNQFGGNWNALAAQFTGHILPYPVLTSEGNNAAGFHPYGPQFHYQLNWAISANVVRIEGNHTLKVGFEGRLENQEQAGSLNSGSFAFNGSYTGNDFADLLLGYPANSGKGPGGSNPGFLVSQFATGYNRYQAYYAQDDWHAAPKLTLNLGLRYEIPGSVEEPHDNATVWLPHTVDPVTHITGTLGLVNSALYPSRYVKNPTYSALSPRFGFAYRLGENSVIRGGYALTWLPVDYANNLMPYTMAINGASTGFVNPAVGSLTKTNLCQNNNFATNCFHTSSNPLAPAGTAGVGAGNALILPAGRTQGQSFMLNEINQRLSSPVPTDQFGYNQQYNLNVSHELTGGMLLEIGYAGAKGTHMPVPSGGQNGLDQIPSQYLAMGSALSAPTTKATVDPGGYTAAAGSISVGQSLRPYFAYQDVGEEAQSWGVVNYNAVHATFQKRFGSGGLIMANYTWAKTLGNAETTIGQVEIQSGRGNGSGYTQDWNNHAGEYSVLSFDAPHRFVVAYVYPLPFGHGKAFGANAGGFEDRLIGGWALNGVTQFQTGFPQWLIYGAGNYLTNNLGGGTLRPIYTPGAAGCNGHKSTGGSLSQLTRMGSSAINLACYPTSINNVPVFSAASPTNYQFGNEPRADGGLREAGSDNWDMSLVKRTAVTESTNLELRAEYFNIFNRTQFGPPNNDRSGGNFGVITILANNPRLLQLAARFNF